MKALHLGISKTSTFLNSEFLRRFSAKHSIPARVVLWEKPIATMSFERTRTSPPSIEYFQPISYHIGVFSTAKSLLYLVIYSRRSDSLLLAGVLMW